MKPTRLSVLCDKILEMSWLLALIITPLFFNVYSSRVFEPDKLTTLRTVALIMAAVWVVKYVEERLSGRHELGLTWRTPLVFPTLFMVIVYLLSTALSVTPRVSLFGSYQRLQGTYTTLAYVVVFLIVLQGLRTRAQLDRLITVVILNSLPIALYGLIQHNSLDPLPWAGDVTQRVASNMGNPIFVAAYLIMAALPTLARVIEAFRSILTDEETNTADILRAAVYIFIFLVQLIATWYTQSRGPLMGLLAGLGVWAFLGLLALQRAARQGQPVSPGDLLRDVGRGVAFGLGSLGAAGAVALLLYFVSKAIVGPESRLPQGLALIALVLVSLGAWLVFIVNRRGWRWLWISSLVMALLFAAGFLVANLNEVVHEWSVQELGLGRLANVLQHEGGTGMVRNLIWEGALDLILPHRPIEYPPTEEYPEGRPDPFNALRPLVGYGPESMCVAYNRFYPPLLGHYESRTASPDRSHNETMDSLAITGLLGFAAYLWIFGSVFYFGLRWLGFLPADWRRTLFFALQMGGAVVAVVAVIPTIGPHFFGLAIPIGMVGGLFIYLIVYGFSVYRDAATASQFHPHFVLLAGILCAVVAHFVEINFGIAIAATRTTFWAYVGVFVVAGMGLVRGQEVERREGDKEARRQGDKETRGRRQEAGDRRHRKRRRAASVPSLAEPALPGWLWPVLAAAIIGGFVLGTLAYDFVTNAERLSQPLTIVWRALTILPAQGNRTSYGALMIVTLAWLMGGAIFVLDMARGGTFRDRQGDGALALTLYLLVSLAIGVGFALALAGRRASLIGVQAQTLEDVMWLADRVAGLLAMYYGFIICVLVAGGVVLWLGVRRQARQAAHPWGVIALVVLTVLVGATAVRTNLRPIQADVVYKQADPYDREGQWPVAIKHYEHAIALAPREDFYYLYLGRAYLEYASSVEDPAVRDTLLRKTEQVLVQAREINPLNTDHSANLARMYQSWAGFASDTETRRALEQRSSDNYATATSLSPHHAILWNEWAVLQYYGLGDRTAFEQTMQHSLELDPDFDETWMVQGDVHMVQNEPEEAIADLKRALDLNPQARPQGGRPVWHWTVYYNALAWYPYGYSLAIANRYEEATIAFLKALELEPNALYAWDCHRVLAIAYQNMGQIGDALFHAQAALGLAPEDQRPAMQELVAQLSG